MNTSTHTKRTTLSVLVLATLSSLPGVHAATTFEIIPGTAIFTPSFRGASNTTWVGWETFRNDADPSNSSSVINDALPDIGTGNGSFVTTNGEDHISSSFNYYSGGGTVAETISFGTAGIVGTGFTTIVAQGITAFGPFGATINFSDIAGVTANVVTATNSNNAGQFWAKWEIPGNAANYSFDISTASDSSLVSFTRFVVDTQWAPTLSATDTAIIPEPTSAILGLVSCGILLRRRRN